MLYRAVNPISPPLAARQEPARPPLLSGTLDTLGRFEFLRAALRPSHTPQMIGVGAGLAAIAPTRPFDRPLRLFVSQNATRAAPDAGRKPRNCDAHSEAIMRTIQTIGDSRGLSDD